MSAEIVCVGAAVQDVFLSGKILNPHCEDGVCYEELLLGAKLELDEIIFSTGGGATNAAVTFARQGLHARYMGKIGRDPAGDAVLRDLHLDGVDSSLVKHSNSHATGYSALLLAPNGERTVLTYRGASTEFKPEDFEHLPSSVHADWFYVSSLAGSMDALEHIIDHAEKHGIKVALNPGSGELKHAARLRKLLPKLTLISLNKEEMQTLVEGETIQDLVRAAAEHVPYVVVTDGPKGSCATDRDKVYTAGMYEDVPVIDRTGAGDAFASGFTAAVAKGEGIVRALTLGSANSTSVVGKIGAKAGILHHHDKLHDMPVKVVDFSETRQHAIV